MKMKKTYFLIVLLLCGLSVGNLFAAAPAAAAVEAYLGKKLRAAAKEGNEPEVKELIALKANVNADDPIGWTALMWAVIGGHENIVKMLLQVDGIDVNATTINDGWTALMFAAREGHENIVETLLQVDGIDVNAANRDGYTALMWAAEEGHENIVKMLLGKALMEAAGMGHENIVERLLQVDGIDVNVGAHGYTALIRAAEEGHENIVKMLLDKGADTTIQTKFAGATAYDLAKTQEIKNILERARLWQVQRELERPAGGTSPFGMLPRDMIGEVMRQVQQAEFPE